MISTRGTRALGGALCLAASCLGAAAALAADVGYVASLVGDATVEGRAGRAELAFLDLLPEDARLHLEAASELRICHSGAGNVFSMTGPAVARMTGSALVAESGPAPVRTGERCKAPLVSRTQGGAAFRSIGAQPIVVGVRSWLRLLPGSSTPVVKATLLSPDEASRLAEFQAISLSPVALSDGSTYPLVVEFADGRKVTVRLAAKESEAAEVALITVSP